MSQDLSYLNDFDAATMSPNRSVSTDYHYLRKNLVMTKAEARFFKILDSFLSPTYYVFPQVHLHALFEHKIKGQNFWSAYQHINRKSVDFVVCDRNSLSPLLAIELDDWSHDLDHRKLRDIEVERIFANSSLPLIRFRFEGNPIPSEVQHQVSQSLSSLQE